MTVESNEDLYARRHREKTEHLPITRGQLSKLSQFNPHFEFQDCKVLCDGLIEFEGRLATRSALGQKVYVYLDDEGRMLANISFDRSEKRDNISISIWKARKFFNWADPWIHGKPENVEEIESEYDFSLNGGLVPDIRQWCVKEIIKIRLEYLRAELRAERISVSELIDLQGLAEYIDPGDVELLEAAGVPEFPEEESCSTDAQ